MALSYTSDNITNKKYTPPSAPHSARECYQAMGTVTVDDAVEADDLIGLVVLPANCIPTDCTLVSTDLDAAGPAITVNVGILTAIADSLVNHSLLMSLSPICGTGGGAGMNINECAFNPATWLAEADCPGINEDKIVALHVEDAATTAQAGTIDFVLNYRSAENGV